MSGNHQRRFPCKTWKTTPYPHKPQNNSREVTFSRILSTGIKRNDRGDKVAGPRLNIKTVLSTYGDFHVKDKTAVRTSYLQHGNRHTWKDRLSYWDGPQFSHAHPLKWTAPLQNIIIPITQYIKLHRWLLSLGHLTYYQIAPRNTSEYTDQSSAMNFPLQWRVVAPLITWRLIVYE